jgi:hypothetical protein
MSLLSTDWHINQMKRKAYNSEPLPITMNEFDYRNGQRDYIIIQDRDNPDADRPHSVQEAIDYIMKDGNKEYFEFSCQEEPIINFRKLYLKVDKEACVANGIVKAEEAHLMEDTIFWSIKGTTLYKADLAVLDILANYKWDRPIYFASIAGMQANQYLSKYMRAEGLTHKLTPIDFGPNGGTDTEKMYNLVMGTHTLDTWDGKTEENIGFLWGNMKGDGVLVDYYTMRMVQNIRVQMMKFTNALLAEGKKEECINVLDKVFEEMPIENNQVAPDDICFYLCANYYEAGAKEKGDALGKQLGDVELQKMKYYHSQEEVFFEQMWQEWGRAMNNIEMLREASLKDMPMEQMFDKDPSNTFFSQLGVFEGTEYAAVCGKAKTIFQAKAMEKVDFFSRAQSFPRVYTSLWSNM